jgi:hypothetical protein
VRAALKYSEK